jgi:hypothetical protein
MISEARGEGISPVRSRPEWHTVTTKPKFIRKRGDVGIRKYMRSVLIAGILLGASIFTPATQADAAAGQYHLNLGQKLTVGKCIVSTKGQRGAVAKLCMGKYANALIYYKGVLKDEFGPNHVTSAQPRAYITLASDHNVKIYKYSGGPLLFNSKTAGRFPATQLWIDSCAALPYWNVALVKPGSFNWPWKGEHCVG